MMTIIEIEAALRAFLDAAKGHGSLIGPIGPCEICLTQSAAYAALDQLVQHRCALPPSIQEALNSGDGGYHP